MELIESSNAERCGIYTFHIATGSVGEHPSQQQRCHGTILSLDTATVIASANLKGDSISKYGINVHSAMLKPGAYELILDCGTEQARARFSTPHVTILAEEIRAEMIQYGTPYIFSDPTDSGHYPYLSTKGMPWFDRPDALNHIEFLLNAGSVNEDEAKQLRRFVIDGLLIIENAFDDEFIGRLNSDLDDVIQKKFNGYQYGSSERIEHLHLHYDAVRELWLNEICRKYIGLLFAGSARPCQTLTFIFGSQQDAHQDTIHLTPYPAGYMCGVWVALQDILPDSGELVVYPGSHREPRLRMAELNCSKVAGDWAEFGKTVVPIWKEMSKKYESLVYRPKKGTALIWHENLLHAGSKRLDPNLERRSIVIHYFSNDAVAYYDSSGMPGQTAPMKCLQASGISRQEDAMDWSKVGRVLWRSLTQPKVGLDSCRLGWRKLKNEGILGVKRRLQ